MNLIRYIVFLGILNIVFGFIWKWIVVVPFAMILAPLRTIKAMIVLKLFGAYLLVSLSALLTLDAIHASPGLFSIILYSIIGSFVLYMGVAQNTYESQKHAITTENYGLLDSVKYDGIIIIGMEILFVITLFIPNIAYNPLVLSLMNVTMWLIKLPVIGWLLSIAGALFLLNIIFYGFIFSAMMISTIIAKIKGDKSNN